MPLVPRVASGLNCLELVTVLLQRARQEHPTAGLWEAADLQWWWRQPRASDSIDQAFWVDGAEQPVGAVVFTDWGRTWGCDLIVVPSLADQLMPAMWLRAVDRIGELSISDVEVLVADEDQVLADLVTDAGLAATHQRDGTMWMDAATLSAVPPIPDRYRLGDRTEAGGRPHHMVPRSGSQVAERLAQTSLYRPDLDLFIATDTDAVAAYGLFWFDPSTGIGLVEPMRTEDGHQGKGLGRHLLATGLERLAGLGASRLKVSYEIGNRRAQRLYTGAGFTPESTNTIYARRG